MRDMKIEATPATRERITKIQCDRCGRVDDDPMEIQEYLRYGDTAGYGSRHIMDMTQWTLDLCQDCVHETIGPFIKKVETETWESMGDSEFSKLLEEEMKKYEEEEPPVPAVPLAGWAFRGTTSLPRADRNGHRERYSDSSNFDGICVLCGCTDNSPDMKEPCPNPFPDEVAETYDKWKTGPLSREIGLKLRVWFDVSKSDTASEFAEVEVGSEFYNRIVEGQAVPPVRAWRVA